MTFTIIIQHQNSKSKYENIRRISGAKAVLCSSWDTGRAGQKPRFVIKNQASGFSQGWKGKTQPGLTHPVKTGLNHIEKPTKVGKIGFY